MSFQFYCLFYIWSLFLLKQPGWLWSCDRRCRKPGWVLQPSAGRGPSAASEWWWGGGGFGIWAQGKIHTLMEENIHLHNQLVENLTLTLEGPQKDQEHLPGPNQPLLKPGLNLEPSTYQARSLCVELPPPTMSSYGGFHVLFSRTLGTTVDANCLLHLQKRSGAHQLQPGLEPRTVTTPGQHPSIWATATLRSRRYLA